MYCLFCGCPCIINAWYFFQTIGILAIWSWRRLPIDLHNCRKKSNLNKKKGRNQTESLVSPERGGTCRAQGRACHLDLALDMLPFPQRTTQSDNETCGCDAGTKLLAVTLLPERIMAITRAKSPCCDFLQIHMRLSTDRLVDWLLPDKRASRASVFQCGWHASSNRQV